VPLFSLRQFAARNPAFSEPSLRWIRFNQRSNGFARAFVKVGRRVLVNEDIFFECIRQCNPGCLDAAVVGTRPPAGDSLPPSEPSLDN
jgi:hypothetical protein